MARGIGNDRLQREGRGHLVTIVLTQVQAVSLAVDMGDEQPFLCRIGVEKTAGEKGPGPLFAVNA